MTQKNFPNGFTSWYETHFEISVAIHKLFDSEHYPDKIRERYEESGYGALYELSEELTDKFEKKYEHRVWEGCDYYETLNEFIAEEFTQ